MKKIFAGNWKLFKSPSETKDFFKDFLNYNFDFEKNEIIFFPSALAISTLAEILSESKIGFGCQNCYFEDSGAYTGENSIQMMEEVGCKYILIGHSERRTLFGETNEAIQKKIKTVEKHLLTSVLCIGETLQERESNRTFEILQQQLKGLTYQKTIVAYEPVWAIGTGKIASNTQVSETHQFIFEELSKMGLGKVPILYGGSVKPDNSRELLALPHVDGFLVGGASLKPEQFYQIITN